MIIHYACVSLISVPGGHQIRKIILNIKPSGMVGWWLGDPVCLSRTAHQSTECRLS